MCVYPTKGRSSNISKRRSQTAGSCANGYATAGFYHPEQSTRARHLAGRVFSHLGQYVRASMLNKALYVIAVVLALRMIYYSYYILLARRFLTKYQKYLKNQNDWYITEKRQKIAFLFRRAGIEDSYVSDVEPAGYGYLTTQTVSVFQNIPSLRRDIARLVFSHLKESRAVFIDRILDTLNPIHWLEALLYLPQKISTFLGFQPESIIVKASQVIWWFLGAISILISIFFNREFIVWVSNMFK